MERFTNGTRADCLLLDPAGQIGIEVDPGEDQDGQEGVVGQMIDGREDRKTGNHAG